MTAFDYGRSTATANRLIGRFGQVGSIRRAGAPTGPVYSPVPGAPVNHACLYVVTDFNAMEIDGTRVLASDKKVLLAKGALTVEPRVTDVLVEADAGVYKIVSIKPLKPGSAVVLWELQVRR